MRCEEVWERTVGVGHQEEHAHVPESLLSGLPLADEELAEEGEGGAVPQPVAVEQNPGRVGETAVLSSSSRGVGNQVLQS